MHHRSLFYFLYFSFFYYQSLSLLFSFITLLHSYFLCCFFLQSLFLCLSFPLYSFRLTSVTCFISFIVSFLHFFQIMPLLLSSFFLFVYLGAGYQNVVHYECYVQELCLILVGGTKVWHHTTCKLYRGILVWNSGISVLVARLRHGNNEGHHHSRWIHHDIPKVTPLEAGYWLISLTYF
jgi:hypothetical protein